MNPRDARDRNRAAAAEALDSATSVDDLDVLAHAEGEHDSEE